MHPKQWNYMKLNGTTSQEIIIFSGYVSLVNIMAAFLSSRLRWNNFIHSFIHSFIMHSVNPLQGELTYRM